MEAKFLSWTLFFFLTAILAVVWFLTTQTLVGRQIIANRTNWSQRQWSRFLIVLLATVFIMVNPIYHLLATAVGITLYYILVDNRSMGEMLAGIKNINTNSSTRNDGIKPNLSQTLLCQGKNHASMSEERLALERSLFSFPYINSRPTINYEDSKYTIQVSLTDGKYLASLQQYISEAGFHVS